MGAYQGPRGLHHPMLRSWKRQGQGLSLNHTDTLLNEQPLSGREESPRRRTGASREAGAKTQE